MSWRVNKLVLVFGLLAMSGIAQFVFSLALAINQYGDEVRRVAEQHEYALVSAVDGGPFREAGDSPVGSTWLSDNCRQLSDDGERD